MDLKAAGKPVPPHDDPRTFNIKSKRMEPMCVEGIGQSFPDLNCIMAHFGSTGRRDVSEGIIRWHLEPRHIDFFLETLAPLHPEKYAHKLLFATDLSTNDVHLLDAKIASHDAIYDAVGINAEDKRKMFRDTAARLLGLE